MSLACLMALLRQRGGRHPAQATRRWRPRAVTQDHTIMKQQRTSLRAALAGGCLLAASVAAPASAATVYWTDWTSASAAAGTVSGTLSAGSDTVSVGYSGGYGFAQTSGGTNYWTPASTFQSATVSNAPPAADIIALSTGGTATVTFSQAVVDPLLALVSWNSNTVEFGAPIEFLSYGVGPYGSGTPILNAAGTGFFGSGEVHGVLRVIGTYTSISFTHTSEYWHGFTVGIVGVSTPGDGGGGSVPEPMSLALLGLGFGALALTNRRRQR
jgi:hypothetical protein